MTPSQSWLRCPQPQSAAEVRLVCFPHAGGSASAYRAWPALLGARIEVRPVQYPGREDRFGEPFVDDLDAVADTLVEEVARLSDRPYAFFGHSMGGAIAYEVAQRLEHQGGPGPVHLFVSGRQPPMHHREGTVHTLDDARLGAELVRLSPANADLLSEPELACLVLPIIRDDYRLIERYRPRRHTVLAAPITVLLGDQDDELTLDEARDWGRYTEHDLVLHELPGDHFYLVEQRRAVTALVASGLRPVLSPHSTP